MVYALVEVYAWAGDGGADTELDRLDSLNAMRTGWECGDLSNALCALANDAPRPNSRTTSTSSRSFGEWHRSHAYPL